MVSMIFASLATLMVVVRLATRVFLVKKVGLDDWLMVAAVILSFGVSATVEIRTASKNRGELAAE